MTKLNAGDTAPDFQLSTYSGEQFTLSAQRGTSILLYFYPEADTPACTDQNIGFSQALAQFAERNIKPVGISPDGVEKLAKFRADYGLTQTLLSDPDHLAIGPYGAWGEKLNYGRTYMGLIRSTVLIDADGKIARVWPNIRAKGHVERVLKAVS